ncbi:helix-turn-helix transcriptional regulator [Paenibacillus cisolokensis]|uniref:helix-turn-helix domain-containing protein n=1 Tax=Paenibacillus cisolokensis TaxID=1658519 RepID=UPI003D2E3993
MIGGTNNLQHFSRGECLLQYWLNNRGISQAELSRRTGYSTRIVSYWCNNERLMNADAMYTVSVILNIRMDQLYTWRLNANSSRRMRD